MKTVDDYLSAFIVLAVAAFVLLALSNPLKEYRRKHIKVFMTIETIAVVFFIVKGIVTGDKFQFAFAALFTIAFLLDYFKMKKEKKTE